ncbi:MAG: hypothetical protein AAB629_02075 [Patescibacteria group bacterium]
MNQKGFANIIFIVLVVIIAGVAGYFILRKISPTEISPPPPISTQQSNTTNPISPTASPTPKNETDKWQTYQSKKYQFSLDYPSTGRIGIEQDGSTLPGIVPQYTYHTIQIPVHLSSDYPITKYDGWGKQLHITISKKSEGKSCADIGITVFKNGNSVTIGGRLFMFYDRPWTETSGSTLMAKHRYYGTETTVYCYVFDEAIMGAVPSSTGNKPPPGLNVLFGTTSENPPDIINQISNFFDTELIILDQMVHTIKISG